MLKKYTLVFLIVFVNEISSATDYYMDGSDAAGTSSFNSGINWNDDNPPAPGNNYFTAGNNMRTPDGDAAGDNHIFAGDSLTLNGGGIGWKSAGICTVSNLVIDGGYLMHSRDNTLGRLRGNVWVNPGKIWTIDATAKNTRNFSFYSQIGGSGDILAKLGSDDGTEKRLMLYGINTNFTGKIQYERYGPLGFADERALGANPSSYTYDQFSIYGGWVDLTNSITIDDPNRGINLRSGSSYGMNGGGFDVKSGTIATVFCLINGDGDLGKRGGGKLVLATNETYTGNTYISEGELNIAPGASIVSTGVVVTGSSSVLSGTGVLDTVTLIDGGSIRSVGGGFIVNNMNLAGGIIEVDPSVDDLSVPRITVTGSLTVESYQPIVINVLNLDTAQQSFKILDADDLAGIGPHEFCLNPPWAGFLSVEDNGSGGKVLMLRTQPSDKIVYQTSTDGYGTSAFFKTNWSDYLAPSAGKIYVNDTYEMRTPPSGDHTFAGDRLVFNGMNLGMKGSGLPTVNDFVIMNESSMSLGEPPTGQLDGHVTLYPLYVSGKSYALRIFGNTPLRSFHMYADLIGDGELRMSSGGDPVYGDCAYTLRAMNTNFFGRVRLDGNTNFTLRVTCEENIGGNPPAFCADQLVFNGGGLSVTNDVIIDDANRGFTLLADGGVSDTSGDAGAFTNGTPVAERTYGGGAALVAESGDTLTISCPITGPGGILKNGAGNVVLSGGNSYTGLTKVVQGGLAGTSASAFGGGPVSVDGEGRLLTFYSESMPSNGIELGGMIEFLNGGAVRIELADGVSQPAGSFSVPLFLLPEGESINPGDIPVEHMLSSVGVEVTTSVVSERTLVSVSFVSSAGTLILLK